MSKYSALFSEGYIGTCSIKNRILMAPMATNFAGPEGSVTRPMIDYYAERARGDVGMIIVENANVDFPTGANGAVQLRVDADRYIPGLATLCEVLKDINPDCKVALQLNHAGAHTRSSRVGGDQIVGPSNIPTTPAGETPRPLTAKEIEGIALKFGEAAKRAQKAGFDAVEIHGGFAYLIAQFMSPFYNRRTDDYGGSVENMLRFPLMVVKEIRKQVGRNYPVLFRMNGEEFVEGGLTLELARVYAKLLEEASVDLLHITAGNGYRIPKHIEPMSYPEGWKVYLASEIKKVVKIPVAAVGVIRNPSFAEEIIVSGKADFVALGRALIADPHWVRKVRLDKVETINRCISCNECARRRLFLDLPIRCTVNPVVGSEGDERKRIDQTRQGKKVMIIGGGPAGMRASIDAKKDGHQVTLYEREHCLGGQALLATKPPHKEKIRWLLEDLENQMKSLNIEIRLGVSVDEKTIREYKPDVIIVATGAEPYIPSISGISGPNVIAAHDLLRKVSKPSNLKVGIIGGGSVGCECAEYLADNGNHVIIFEMLDEIAPDLDAITRSDLMMRLDERGVIIETNHCVQSVTQDGVICKHGEEMKHFSLDLVVVATGVEPRNTLLERIKALEFDSNVQVIPIGDCFKPGKIIDAIRQAYSAIRRLRQ